ncbi:hypothetical protein AAC387_Pa05g2109 [Persea americana]
MENHEASSSRHPNRAHEPGFDPNRWLTLGTGPQERRAARRTHACLFCPRTFSTSQALGGHQHFHRRGARRESATMFAPNHVPIVRVEPSTGLLLGLGLGAGARRMNPVPANGCPDLLERRLGLRVDEDEGLLGRMAESDGESGEVTEVTATCTELKNKHWGHESGDGHDSEEGGADVNSNELDLTLRL